MSSPNRILFVDAYDSFTRNIVALCYRSIATADITVIHIDTNIEAEFGVDLASFVSQFHAVILGPGPGNPRNKADIGLFENVLDIVTRKRIPLLGICLGFQLICLKNGCNLIRMSLPCHGQQKIVHTTGTDIFEDLELGNGVTAVCYNSLAICATDVGLRSIGSTSKSSSGTSTPQSEASSTQYLETPYGMTLQLLAEDECGYAMAIRHEELPVWGVQFHPESCFSQSGEEIIRNWWRLVLQHNHQTGWTPCASDKLSSQMSSKLSHVSSLSSLSTTTIGNVQWRMSKFSKITSNQLSRLCYESNRGSPIAMLESTAKGRYCIYGFTHKFTEILEYAGGRLKSKIGNHTLSKTPMPSHEALLAVERRTRSVACKNGCSNVPFWGGWIGYMSYELGLDLLEVESSMEREVPDFSFAFIDRSVVLDQRTGNICIQSIRSDDVSWVDSMQRRLKRLNGKSVENVAEASAHTLSLLGINVTLPERRDYDTNYERVVDHLNAGNSYELCLTTEATVDMPHNADSSYLLYQNLNRHNPVPYAAMLHFPKSHEEDAGCTILSTSPELFLSSTRTGTLDMMPMKGTVQRTPETKIEDVYQILSSPKETAENLMIADLIRHDLYSVVGCKQYPWFQQSPDPMKPAIYMSKPYRTLLSQDDNDHDALLELADVNTKLTRDPLSILALNSIKTFETVYQLVSHIRAHPPPHLDISNPAAIISHNHSALHHVLPPGSMTGAPKKRSCEILQQLERRNRGIYSGIIGYIDVGGGSCWSVAIRTAWSSESEDYIVDKDFSSPDSTTADAVEIEKRKLWHVGAGGAVTVLSDLEGEWQEMTGKMNNVLKAFREVKHDFQPWHPG